MALIALLLPVLAVLALVLTAKLESWMQPSARAPQPSQPVLSVDAEAPVG